MEFQPFAGLRVSWAQKFLAFVAVIILAALGVSTVRASNEAVRASNLLSDIETPAASIIFTQRETLVYATRLAQWSNGGTTRREVQIARNLLAQRLSVIDSSGQSMSDRADDEYWSALKDADIIIKQSPSGVLPEKLHASVSEEMTPVINRILASSRELIVSYQESVDAQMLKNSERAASLNRLNLTLFYLFLIVGLALLILSHRTNYAILKKMRSEITDERQKLENTISELEDLNTSKNQFIATVNHELRTPLTSIIGYVEMLRDDQIVREVPRLDNYLEVVDRNADILLDLVESALALSKMDSTDGERKFGEFQILNVIDRAIFVMRPASEKQAIQIVLENRLPQDQVVVGDPGLISQVLLNLLGNAIKFSPSKNSVRITLDTTRGGDGAGMIAIRISDSGIGIPAEDIGHLFTRFFRAKNAIAEHYQGSGIGLAIAHQILSIHGGNLTVESEVGVGSTFTATLPLPEIPIDSLIERRKLDVLKRSLERLRNADEADLSATAHEIGGAIGFYGYVALGAEILEFSRKSFVGTNQAQSELDTFIEALEREIASVSGDGDE